MSIPNIQSIVSVKLKNNLTRIATITGTQLDPNNTVDVTLATIGSTPNSAGGSIATGQVFRLQPANATNPGILTVTAQTMKGAKAFDEVVKITPSSNQLVLGNTTISSSPATSKTYTINNTGSGGNNGILMGIKNPIFVSATKTMTIAEHDSVVFVSGGGYTITLPNGAELAYTFIVSSVPTGDITIVPDVGFLPITGTLTQSTNATPLAQIVNQPSIKFTTSATIGDKITMSLLSGWYATAIASADAGISSP